MTAQTASRARPTSPPWIRPWAQLTVHAPGNDDLFGRLVPSIHHPGSPEAQANIDYAVAAVNRLPLYEAAVEALQAMVDQSVAWCQCPNCNERVEQARAALVCLTEGSESP